MSNLTKNWTFCPVCARRLQTKSVEGRDKLACEEGHFLFYDNPVPVVAALVLNDSRDGLLLVKRGVEPFIGKWCLPRGFIDTDERPKQAIAREVREEAGLYVWLTHSLPDQSQPVQLSAKPGDHNFSGHHPRRDSETRLRLPGREILQLHRAA